MAIVFVEYKVFPEKRAAYLQWMEQLQEREQRIVLYEGSDQPDLFVEMWHGMDEEAYGVLKQTRLAEQKEWALFGSFVQGGASRVHMWHFRRSLPNSRGESTIL